MDLFENIGAELRDRGMVEAEFAEALTGSDYAESLYAAICHVARRQTEVHLDDVLPLVKVRPTHANAAGFVWVRAIKEGVLIKTGRTRQCRSDPRKRVHSYPLYASGVFHGRRR